MKSFVLFLLLVCASFAYATDTFTISFGSSDAAYMMQIDEFGNVLTPPVAVQSVVPGSSCNVKTAMADAGNFIYLYTKDQPGNVTFTKIGKASLSPVSSKMLNLPVETNLGGSISSTEEPWFIAPIRVPETLKAVEIDSKGKPDGISWRLSPRTEKSLFNAGVAADGGAVWAIASDETDHTTVLVQGLKSNGRPDSRIEGYKTISEIQSGDLTNILPGNRRFLLFRKYEGDFNEFNTTSQFYLQPIDATTLAKKGSLKIIDNFPFNCFTGGIAVEAQGRFVVFTRHDFSTCDQDLIMYQALDANGNAAGPRIPLTTCADNLFLGGLDIIQN